MSPKVLWAISAVWVLMAAQSASGYPHFGHRWIETGIGLAGATLIAWSAHRANRDDQHR